MIFTDYYRARKTGAHRYDITHSTASYDYFESVLINKAKTNVGGLSFYYVDRPATFKAADGRRAEKAITKGSTSISSVFVPGLQEHLTGYGDVNGSNDALILIFSPDYTGIELFIARGYVHDVCQLYTSVKESGLVEEMERLRAAAQWQYKGAELPNQ